MNICEVCGKSDSECKIVHLYGHLLCPKHRSQLWRHGTLENKRTIYTKNDIRVDGEIAYIDLYNAESCKIAEAIIDAEDVSRCSNIKWYRRVCGNGKHYAMGTINGQKVFLHRFLLNYEGTEDVDHINRNSLDNRKENLRICSHSANIRNQDSVGYTITPGGKYVPRICINYKDIYIGTYDTAEEALEARNSYLQKIA